MLSTEFNDYCHKLAPSGRLSELGGIVNLVQTMIKSLYLLIMVQTDNGPVYHALSVHLFELSR